MATLTRNLFAGNGERDFRLRVVEGHWPSDVEGAVFVVGPDKRGPGGHWLVEHGLLQKVDLVPDRDGRIVVRHRSIRTPVARLRRRLPWLFKRLEFMELSPFGVSNLANTNVQGIDGRLFVGYDAGRPVEVDPETLAFVTFVGHNDEWLQAAPGVLEPLCAVAAHPAPDLDERALWFVNYSQVALPGDPKETWIARWGLDGPIRRWRVEGMSAFDSIHDIKATANHLVFTDLPFVVEPGTFTGAPREQRNQEHTTMWIVAKDELHRTPPGGSVGCLEVRLPIPTGHVYADHDEVDGRLRVVVQHVPLGDLLLSMTPTTIDHRNQAPIDPAYEGLIALAVQPSVIGRYEIDLATGEVHDAELAMDVDRAWGGILPTTDTYSPAARAHQRNLWYAGAGFDPDLVPEEWWRLYGTATDGIVAPADLPDEVVPGSLARFDLESMKVAEVWQYEAGAFPSPPTFVPRVGAEDPDDGYVVVVVHQDGDKELQVFDAQHVEQGPLARATAPGFTPNLMLHSTWMPARVGPHASAYRTRTGRDVVGALRGLPGVLRSFARMGRGVAAMEREKRADT
ncbi:MAG: carotenoid oxygenase family protein [Acidimicrobiales bacterium]|nr:carotenoid oxygenase family protein [Acidimicrobiales bacterium]HRW38370.1 carotenoid oxygenase family protein [Aquihabitans sp.]